MTYWVGHFDVQLFVGERNRRARDTVAVRLWLTDEPEQPFPAAEQPVLARAIGSVIGSGTDEDERSAEMGLALDHAHLAPADPRSGAVDADPGLKAQTVGTEPSGPRWSL
jgi:hypothetical protein